MPIEDTLGALDELVQAGKVREIGCSNFSPEQLRAAEEATREGAARFVSVQNEYSLLHREPEYDVLPECVRARARFHTLLPAGQWPAYGEVPPGSERPRRKPPALQEGRKTTDGPEPNHCGGN